MGNYCMYVRLKPYNAKQGCLRKRYHYKGQLYACDPETGRPLWYKIDDPELVADLSEHYQDPTAYNSPKLFDVADPETHGKLLGEEERRRLVELGIMSPTMVQPVARPASVVDRTSPKEAPVGRAVAVPEPEIQPTRVLPQQEIPDPVELPKEAEVADAEPKEPHVVSIGNTISLSQSLADETGVPKRKPGRPRLNSS